MRVLIVDDDVDLLRALKRRVERISSAIDCVVVESVEEAQNALNVVPPDVCVVDLQLPSGHKTHDATIDKGEALIREIAQRFPGTFVIMYSGYSDNSITDPLYEQLNAQRPNVLGKAEPAMFVNRPKAQPLKAVEDIARIFKRRRELIDSISFENYQIEAEIDRSHSQIFRAFGKSRGASTIRVAELHGGKSGASVYAVTYFDLDGNTMLQTVIKIDHWSNVQNEEQKFEAYVVGMLQLGTYAPLLNRVPFICADTAGMVYEEITPRLGDFTLVWNADVQTARMVVDRIQQIEKRWTDTSVTEQFSVADIRRKMISDTELEAVAGYLPFRTDGDDRIIVRSRVCLQHGDFHAGNVLLKSDYQPYFLDFASIDRFPKGFDALTLELAYVFNNPFRVATAWPDEATIRGWDDAETYFKDCPARPAMAAIRDWARSSTAGFPPAAAYALVYAYALRQLKFSGPDKTLAIALAETMKRLLERS